MRYLVGSIQDWYALFREAYRCTKPGGFLETFDTGSGIVSDDDSVAKNSAMHEWGKLFAAGGKIIGRSFNIRDDDVQRKGMEAAGFVDIKEENIKVMTTCSISLLIPMQTARVIGSEIMTDDNRFHWEDGQKIPG